MRRLTAQFDSDVCKGCGGLGYVSEREENGWESHPCDEPMCPCSSPVTGQPERRKDDGLRATIARIVNRVLRNESRRTAEMRARLEVARETCRIRAEQIDRLEWEAAGMTKGLQLLHDTFEAIARSQHKVENEPLLESLTDEVQN